MIKKKAASRIRLPIYSENYTFVFRETKIWRKYAILGAFL